MTHAFYFIVYDIVFHIERKINYFIYFIPSSVILQTWNTKLSFCSPVVSHFASIHYCSGILFCCLSVLVFCFGSTFVQSFPLCLTNYSHFPSVLLLSKHSHSASVGRNNISNSALCTVLFSVLLHSKCLLFCYFMAVPILLLTF